MNATYLNKQNPSADKRHISNSSDSSDDECSKRCTRRPKLRRRPTRRVFLHSRSDQDKEDSSDCSDDDGHIYSDTASTSDRNKIVLRSTERSTSSNESENDVVASPSRAFINDTTTDVCSQSSHDSGDEDLSTVSAYGSGGTDLVFSPEDAESEDQNVISSDANFSTSSRDEALDSCEGSSENDCSSSETDNSSLSDNEGDCANNMFTKSIYESSNLSLGASCIVITQFIRKYKLSRTAQNDLLTLIKLHCPEGVEIAIPKTYKELLRRTMPSLATVKNVRVCSICTKKIEENATVCEDGHPAGKPTKEDSYFFEIPLEPQLKMVIEGTVSFWHLYVYLFTQYMELEIVY